MRASKEKKEKCNDGESEERNQELRNQTTIQAIHPFEQIKDTSHITLYVINSQQRKGNTPSTNHQ
jgi:hypothetical protein